MKTELSFIELKVIRLLLGWEIRDTEESNPEWCEDIKELKTKIEKMMEEC